MSNSKRKWWLALVAICCLAPAAFAYQDGYKKPYPGHYQGPNPECDTRDGRCPTQQVPEGGSTAIYLLGAGLTCFGAMFLGSRQSKPTE